MNGLAKVQEIAEQVLCEGESDYPFGGFFSRQKRFVEIFVANGAKICSSVSLHSVRSLCPNTQTFYLRSTSTLIPQFGGSESETHP